jgi:hypothetical protein
MTGITVEKEMAWYDRKENSTGALCARLSGDASKVQKNGPSTLVFHYAIKGTVA